MVSPALITAPWVIRPLPLCIAGPVASSVAPSMPPLPRRAEGDEDDDDEEDLDDDDEEDLDEEDLDGATATTSATTGRSRVTCLGIQSVGLYLEGWRHIGHGVALHKWILCDPDPQSPTTHRTVPYVPCLYVFFCPSFLQKYILARAPSSSTTQNSSS